MTRPLGPRLVRSLRPGWSSASQRQRMVSPEARGSQAAGLDVYQSLDMHIAGLPAVYYWRGDGHDDTETTRSADRRSARALDDHRRRVALAPRSTPASPRGVS